MKTVGAIASVLLALALPLRGQEPAPAVTQQTVAIEFFFEPGCPICRRVSEEVLPDVQARFGHAVRLERRDTTADTNYFALARYQDLLGVRANESAILVVDGAYAFAGWDEISTGLAARVEERLLGAASPSPPVPARRATDSPEDASRRLASRVSAFTAAQVAWAGLLDGINPCAISTLVFFMSLLSVSKVRGARLLMVGATFCAASFLTYAAIGFGLLNALHALAAFGSLQRAITLGMVAVLVVFALLSFRDAWRYRASRNPGDVTLQLPDGVKNLIHRTLHRGLKARSLLAGSLLAGAAVTAFESVCTGQVYVPTLVFVVRSGGGRSRALAYLLLYNVCFILPLVAAFVLTYRGLRIQSFLAWSRTNVVVSKVLLGIFFAIMAALLVAM